MSSIAFMSSFFLELVTLIHQLLQLVDFRFIVLPGLTDDLLLFLNPFIADIISRKSTQEEAAVSYASGFRDLYLPLPLFSFKFL